MGVLGLGCWALGVELWVSNVGCWGCAASQPPSQEGGLIISSFSFLQCCARQIIYDPDPKQTVVEEDEALLDYWFGVDVVRLLFG